MIRHEKVEGGPGAMNLGRRSDTIVNRTVPGLSSGEVATAMDCLLLREWLSRADPRSIGERS